MRQPENALWINTVRAARLRIANGDKVRVKSPAGEVILKAMVTEAIHPSAVFMAHGFGHKAKLQRLAFGKGANDNTLIANRVVKVHGGSALAETLVTVERVA